MTGDGLQVVVGDMLKIEDMEAAAHGTSLMFFCFPVSGGLMEATTTAALAARKAGMHGIVNLSQWCSKVDSHSPHSRKHALSEAVRTPRPFLARTATVASIMVPQVSDKWTCGLAQTNVVHGTPCAVEGKKICRLPKHIPSLSHLLPGQFAAQ